MAKLSQSEQLDRIVTAVIERPAARLPQADRKLAPLARIAADLRGLPTAEFKARLKSDLERRASMATPAVNPIREGFHTVTPYILVPGAAEFMEFLKQAFGATEVLCVKRPDGKFMHAEARIDDSMIEMADYIPEIAKEFPAMVRGPAAIHLYVKDADAVYRRALDAGASKLAEPTDQPYGDREAGVKDSSGNFWYIATHKATGHAPAGLRAVTPYLHPRGAGTMIEFLKNAFGAEVAERDESPSGEVVHAKIRIGDSIVELSEAHGEFQPMPSSIHLYVNDADAYYQRAIRAGATSLIEPRDEPYGDRASGVKDPFGHIWFIATHIKDVKF